MKIAVTAANGNLGSAIVKQLIRDIGNENVIGIARSPEKAEYLGVEIRKAEYENREDFNEALRAIDMVLIVSGMDKPDKRIQQHQNIIEAAKENGLKKIVYTSIIGKDSGNDFSPIVRSNRQTEEDVKNSGLEYVIGRNGLYIEPDLLYLENYKKDGGIINCAGDGLCSYTCRNELAYAYSKMLLGDNHIGNTYNLVGEGITQKELAYLINEIYGTRLSYKTISTEDYIKFMKEELGDFMGTIIGGIYVGIKYGAFDVRSDFMKATGRAHKTPAEMIYEFKRLQKAQ